jgi:hypothetical protein
MVIGLRKKFLGSELKDILKWYIENNKIGLYTGKLEEIYEFIENDEVYCLDRNDMSRIGYYDYKKSI